ncbi:MAG: DEAD/DEAH box helicase, partial [Candidatus Odinarchaeota archaeon]
MDVNSRLIDLLKKEGYSELYPTQEQAFKTGALAEGNLVLACPTASGKTLVAEICIIDTLMRKGGKAVYLLPLRALASEKYEDFKKYNNLGFKVALTSGDLDTADPYLARYDIIIMTNEKMDSLIRHNVNWLREISIIVVDEIHIINDASRGVTLEIIIAKLRRVAPQAKILGLSATISNSNEIANWLNARLVESDWRPVKLKEGVLLYDTITFNTGECKSLNNVYEDSLLDLTVETVNENGQVLIFTNTRKSTVSLSRKISKAIESLLKRNERKVLERVAERILNSREQTNLGRTLAETIRRGVAFHNAGLPYEYRRIVEEGFKNNLIKVVTATPTLSAGLNMPARRVIIKDYRRYDAGLGYMPISVLEIKQMAGRAGRPKYDVIGEAILISGDKREFDFLMTNYVFGEPERIWSKLASEPALRTHILSSIATKFTETYDELIDFLKETFYAQQYRYEVITSVVQKIIDYLVEEEMVISKEGVFKATPFGKKVSELYIDPKSGEIIKDALFASNNKNITEFSFLHLIAHTPDMEPLYLRKRDYDDLELLANTVK